MMAQNEQTTEQRSRLILLIYESHSIRSTNCMHVALADLLLEIIMVRGMV